MKILKEITLHPNLDNDRRSEIIDWCTKNLRIDDEEVTEDRNNWCIRSNYTDHGCFN